MDGPLVLVDQTVNEGLRLGLGLEKIDFLLQALRQLQVDIIDVKAADWKIGYWQSGSAIWQQLVRGRINPLCHELEESQRRGFRKVLITYHHHPGQPVNEAVHAVLVRAASLALEVSLCIENASQLSLAELVAAGASLAPYRLHSLVYGDKNSCLDPLLTPRILSELKAKVSCPLEFHAHNGLGLATANTLSALRAGVRQVAVAAGGVGGCGHAPLEEVVMAGKYLLQAPVRPSRQLAVTCAKILCCLGMILPPHKAVVGKDIFAHESGIHVDGVAKNPKIYEVFPPEEVGLKRRLIIGKHSGTASLKNRFREWNIILSEEDAQCLLKKVRNIAVSQKSPLTDTQLKNMYCDRYHHKKLTAEQRGDGVGTGI